MAKTKYQVVYQELLATIQEGRLNPGDVLPSENVLSEKYEASRETIRKALNVLAQNGHIQKIKGKGSVVLDTQRMSFPVSGLVSFKELSKTFGGEAVTAVHQFALIQADERIAKHLTCGEGTEVWKIVRSREIRGEKIILDKDYLDKRAVPFLSKEICENSIYEYLEGELGLKIGYAEKEITVEECTNEDRAYLDLHDFTHVVVVKNYVYLEDTTLFQYTESRHRLDKFRFVDFARRGQM
ncbi:trehalose operon repressor [Bacillus sp. FJAT-42376]|uniref:trehalose operon repressor n=1 Tax=Bacillus sp. FJAT-42376 TaxID=2014076 RepID=UPI000F4DD951|nr:trehalose operon repressor [Bacillus sp. FJAT-42376]AZB41663.1 trehalose operon repressor [Bacillus sp. FJAT-42376]